MHSSQAELLILSRLPLGRIPASFHVFESFLRLGLSVEFWRGLTLLACSRVSATFPRFLELEGF